MKAKITVTITRIMDLDSDYYESEETMEQRLRSNVEFARELFHEWSDSESTQWETKGELLPEASESAEPPSEAAAES